MAEKLVQLTEEQRCLATTIKGARCQAARIKGKNYCKWHGGTSVAGQRHAGTKHGLYSKYMPRNIVGAYEQAINDQELLSLRSGVAIVETRICELLSQLTSDQAPDLWRQLGHHVESLQSARLNMNEDGVVRAMREIEATVKRGATQQQHWDELFRALTLKKEIATSEWKRLVDMRMVMTVERAFLLISAITELIARHVQDQAVRTKLCGAILSLAANKNPHVANDIDAIAPDSYMGLHEHDVTQHAVEIERLKRIQTQQARKLETEEEYQEVMQERAILTERRLLDERGPVVEVGHYQPGEDPSQDSE